MSNLWNGCKGALSLTFDDGRPSHLGFAIPEMTKRGIFGTFFLVAGNGNEFDPTFSSRGLEWQRAAGCGHEVGSHSFSHRKAEQLKEADAEFEAVRSKEILEKYCTVQTVSYCYPYTDVNDAIYGAVKKHYLQARGGRVARGDKFIRPGEEGFNMHNLPCYHIGSQNFHVNVIPSIILEALDRNAWVTLMFHTIGGLDEEKGIKPWDTVTEEQFQGMLDGLLVARAAGLWVETFGKVAQNLRENMK